MTEAHVYFIIIHVWCASAILAPTESHKPCVELS